MAVADLLIIGLFTLLPYLILVWGSWRAIAHLRARGKGGGVARGMAVSLFGFTVLTAMVFTGMVLMKVHPGLVLAPPRHWVETVAWISAGFAYGALIATGVMGDYYRQRAND